MVKKHILVLCLLCLVMLNACSSHDEPPKPLDLVGLSGQQPEEAELAFAKAYLLWHGYRPSHLSNSDVCSNPAKAVELLTQAIAASPNFHEAYIYRALAFKDMQQYDKALKDINTAIAFQETPNAFAFRSLILTHQKRFVDSQAELNKAFALDGTLPLPWKYQGFLHQTIGEQDKACRDYTRACSYGDCTYLKKSQAEGYCPS